MTNGRWLNLPREEKVMVRLDDRIKVGLQQWADRYGITMSGLAAFILGQWVDAQNRQLEAQQIMLSSATSSVREEIERTTSAHADDFKVTEFMEALVARLTEGKGTRA